MRLGSDRSRRGSHPVRVCAMLRSSSRRPLRCWRRAPQPPPRHQYTRTQSAAAAAARFRHACAKPAKKLTMQCMVLINTAVPEEPASAFTAPAASPAATPAGDGPSQLQSAYSIASAAAASGSGETVYLVDAYDYPTAQADLNAYRSQYGLPACGSGCFTKVNQNGAASPLPPAAGSSGWDVEEALDIDMVSAICPLCHITLVEANSASRQRPIHRGELRRVARRQVRLQQLGRRRVLRRGLRRQHLL